ncbi:hypothetical protein PHLGIDRAFT_130129 [Phlebiopsis gigantea 11061_1 CR5-6]|uniref:Uncharacterized protein n=1 Tax=Phlebiopsis gigantea (strain 11061_1 CR5-6) TaxID=745531 RepID=A0A0C3RSQ7_PHLG1|nr:hypothetical protein PHLGIDRAFT_130129 [Phlebiopsis gigantea 11061_1 CR5-6]
MTTFDEVPQSLLTDCIRKEIGFYTTAQNVAATEQRVRGVALCPGDVKQSVIEATEDTSQESFSTLVVKWPGLEEGRFALKCAHPSTAEELVEVVSAALQVFIDRNFDSAFATTGWAVPPTLGYLRLFGMRSMATAGEWNPVLGLSVCEADSPSGSVTRAEWERFSTDPWASSSGTGGSMPCDLAGGSEQDVEAASEEDDAGTGDAMWRGWPGEY